MKVILLVAPSGQGKTTICRRAVEQTRASGLRVAGLLSLPVYEGQQKTAIWLHNLADGQERLLARADAPGQGPRLGSWGFVQDTLDWGQGILTSLAPCDLLVIDEIGPLEIEQGLGLTNALPALRRREYRQAVLTLRPSLVEAVQALLAGLPVSVVRLDEKNRAGLPL